MKKIKSSFFKLLSVALIGVLLAGCQSGGNAVKGDGKSSGSDDFPKKNIKFIVPSSAGGGFDTSSRQLQPFLQEALGTNLVVENHDGGGTAIGTRMLKNSQADGYSIMMQGTPHLHFSYLTAGDVGYKLNDFVPIGALTYDPGVIRVRRDAKWKDLKELIEYAKTQPPGTISASVSFRTSNNFLALKQLEKATGVEFNIIPYGGGNESRLALLSGEVDLTHAGAFNSINMADETRVIGIQQPSNDWPNVTDNAKTINEQLGIEIPDNSSTYGLFTLRKVKEDYPDRYQKLVEAFKQAVENPDYIAKLKETGEYEKVRYIGPEEYEEMVNSLEKELKEVEHFFKQ
ncbi:tripartite tricarboxylate transporter substrate binding protein [Peribacillus saganii]|uniref:Tripartite tricarboxylate transporter substrate binding protein n=1 Tax=Peribacillus saganii TaxID=2303992 RepID=A0A372LU15_9BACI|nr:tripartite tricarboxylate transporter substrate binding protein [Peribacillus saganii]RFU71387.1 tripartite tricarboxylate transporter substrate binding protein [Peribacillus saganii]